MDTPIFTIFLTGFCTMFCVFTVLHELQTRYSDKNFVCLSVTRVHYDKMVERSVQIFLPYDIYGIYIYISFSLVF